MNHWLQGSVLAFVLENGAQAAEITLDGPGGIQASRVAAPLFAIHYALLTPQMRR